MPLPMVLPTAAPAPPLPLPPPLGLDTSGRTPSPGTTDANDPRRPCIGGAAVVDAPPSIIWSTCSVPALARRVSSMDRRPLLRLWFSRRRMPAAPEKMPRASLASSDSACEPLLCGEAACGRSTAQSCGSSIVMLKLFDGWLWEGCCAAGCGAVAVVSLCFAARARAPLLLAACEARQPPDLIKPL